VFKLSSSFESVYKILPSFGRNWAASAYAWWSGQKKYGGVFRSWSEFLRDSQWWTSDRLLEYQDQQLGELFGFVHQECPFYRDLLSQLRWKPGAASPRELIAKLPVINRAVVRAQYDRIKTRLAVDRKLTLTTSGTTGASLHVPHTLEALQREYAFRWQYYSMGGARRGDRFALFQGQMIVPLSQKRPPYHIRNLAENTVMFSLYHMDDQSMHDYVKVINDFAPEYYYGYPSGLFVLAAFIRASKVAVVKPKAIFTASETLHDFQKETVESTFQAPIYQWYGQVETTVNLHECDRHRFHVKEEYGLLELLGDDGLAVRPGEIGRVIATGWGNRAFPLLRYDTGDLMMLAQDQKCTCGRGGRIIERILGRDDDFVVTPEGRYVGRLDFVFKAVNSVKESQIVQEDEHNLTIRVVPGPGYSAGDEQTVVTKLQERIGTTMKIRVETLDGIPRGGGGKFRYVVSKVKPKFLPPSTGVGQK
jgi:phenylacetate-CoA ligase